SAQIREILINESAWEEMTCLFAPSLYLLERLQPRRRDLSHTTRLIIFSYVGFCHGLYRGFFCNIA
ncbi:hypothetical protein K1D88_22770, partial [Escherichia coli]|nr:hypothetical protein [Escherichia coli]